MRLYKEIENEYILAIGEGVNGKEISREEYDNILSVIRDRPTAQNGYEYRLKENLTWELFEVDDIPEEDGEISDSDALSIITGGTV